MKAEDWEVQEPVPWEPEPYQVEAVRFLLEHAACGLMLRPGMRKTSIVLGAWKILKDERTFRRGLVIAPLRPCYSVWPKEAAKWLDFSGFKVGVLHGPDKQEVLDSDCDICCINPEGLAWLLGRSEEKIMRSKGRRIEYNQTLVGAEGISVKREVHYDLARFKAAGFSDLAVDEASKFRKSNTERFDAIKQILEWFERRYILTGSPRPKWLLDLFGVMYLVDLGRSLGAYITHYRRKYFTQSGYSGFSWVPQLGAEEAIHERIAPSVFSLRASDHIKMPELVEVPVQVELPEKARKLYDELEEEFFSELDDGTPIAIANAGVASISCRQIANGGLWLRQQVDDEGKKQGKREWVRVHDEKTKAAREIVDELFGEPLIIAYDFGHDLERLQAEFPDAPHIGGGVSPKKSDALVAAWNRREIEVLLGHPAAMSHGLNAQEGDACNIALYGLNPDYELFDQLVSRLRRSGNKAVSVFAHLIFARDTVDLVSMRLLRGKEEGQEAFFEAMNEYSVARRGRGIGRKARRTKA